MATFLIQVVILGLALLGVYAYMRSRTRASKMLTPAAALCFLLAGALMIGVNCQRRDEDLSWQEKETQNLLAEHRSFGKKMAAMMKNGSAGDILIVVSDQDQYSPRESRGAAFAAGFGDAKRLKFYTVPQDRGFAAEELVKILQDPYLAACVSLIGLPKKSLWEEADLVAALEIFKNGGEGKFLATKEAVFETSDELLEQGLLTAVCIARPLRKDEIRKQEFISDDDAFEQRSLLITAANADAIMRQYPALKAAKKTMSGE
jgi:hypothetical protein